MAIAEVELAEAEIQPKILPGMPITEEELVRLPKDGPGNPALAKYERVDGRLTEVPTLAIHDQIAFRLMMQLGPYMLGVGGVSLGQAGFRMANGNVRSPDLSFTRESRLSGGRVAAAFGDAAPDLCVEIISPSERPADIERKMRDYFDSGASLVWHVFPEARQVVVFTGPTEARTLNADDILDAGDLLPGFSCRGADVLETE